jgi:hypothetical protein
MSQDVQNFYETMLQDVLITATQSDTALSRHDAFVDLVAEQLIDAGEILAIEKSYKKSKGLEISGYSIDEEDGEVSCTLFTFLFDDGEAISSISSAEVEQMFSRLREFVKKSLEGLADTLDEVDESYAAARIIEDSWASFDVVKLVAITNRRFSGKIGNSTEIFSKTASVQVWDIERLFRLHSSGLQREPITIDVVARLGKPLPCLRGPALEDHAVYLAILPGDFLAQLYIEFGARLLERNVRAFLQTKGSVNKGIRSTVLNQPERFMAYNNGISATASSVNISRDDDGDLSILSIEDLQIVNGGQTTASLTSALKRDKADLSKVAVQAKISVVDSKSIDELVPFISQYSNTQNKVTSADFYANDPFHIAVESFSRTVWAPSADGIREQTRWFYERARGQYADELGRSGTPAQQRKFKAIYPPTQKFTKTDLAKYENSWMQLPHNVSLGAEKNFRLFALGVAEHPIICDEQYFKNLIAKAILFKSADRLIAQQNFGGYKVNTVSYTIAKLSLESQMLIDLDDIWRRQAISPALQSSIIELSQMVFAEIMLPRGRSRHIGEWTKKVDCWTVVRESPWTVPVELKVELRKSRGEMIRSSSSEKGVQLASAEEKDAIEFCIRFNQETWMRLASWGKETKFLAPFQNGIAFGIGKAISDPKKGIPSPKQAVQGMKMMKQAIEKGFSAS